MRRVKVKICGITREEDLKMACNMGADAVGFVVGVPSSPRNLNVEAAKQLIRNVPIFVKSTVVIVPKSDGEVLDFYKRLKPDIIQIHGGKTLNVTFLREKLPETSLVRSLNIKSKELICVAIEELKFFDAVMVDSYSSTKCGGTGLTHDWSISKSIKEAINPKPLILAGGLTPQNVKEAIETVKPYAVDVSTGVESMPGVKDPKKVAAFIRKAKGVLIED